MGEGDWGNLLSHLLREMWIEMYIFFMVFPPYTESSPAGDVD